MITCIYFFRKNLLDKILYSKVEETLLVWFGYFGLFSNMKLQLLIKKYIFLAFLCFWMFSFCSHTKVTKVAARLIFRKSSGFPTPLCHSEIMFYLGNYNVFFSKSVLNSLINLLELSDHLIYKKCLKQPLKLSKAENVDVLEFFCFILRQFPIKIQQIPRTKANWMITAIVTETFYYSNLRYVSNLSQTSRKNVWKFQFFYFSIHLVSFWSVSDVKHQNFLILINKRYYIPNCFAFDCFYPSNSQNSHKLSSNNTKKLHKLGIFDFSTIWVLN